MTNNNQDDEKYVDPVAEFILDFLRNRQGSSTVTFETIAMEFYKLRQRPNDKPDAWRKYLNSVKQQSKSLARSGQVALMRRGEAVDPNNFKGVVRLKLVK